MKRFWVWLLLEYKRAVKILPFVLAEAMALMAVIGAIAFCAQKMTLSDTENKDKAVIALAAEADNRLTEMALSYIQGMQSVASFCRFEQVDFEQGQRMLQSGQAIAMIVLPDTVIEGILDGTNQPAVLYMPKNLSAAGQIFEALTDAGIGMLQTAQAEIYTINDIAVEFGRTDTISDMEYDINIFNLNLALSRENVFKMRGLSVTDNLSIVSYYLAAGMVFFFLLTGLSLCPYFEKENRDCERQLRLSGVPAAGQILGKVSAVFLLLAAAGFIPAAVFGVLCKAGMLTLYFSPANVPGTLLCLLCTAVTLVFFYRMAGSTKSALLWIGIGGAAVCFLAGVFVPSALLPSNMRTLAEYLPIVWMKQLWSGWFYEGEVLWPALCKTAGFSVFLFGLTCFLSERKGAGRG